MANRTLEPLALAIELVAYAVVVGILVWFASLPPYVFFIAWVPGVLVLVSYYVRVKRQDPDYDALRVVTIGLGVGIMLVFVLFLMMWFFVFVQGSPNRPLPWWDLPALLLLLVLLIFSVGIGSRAKRWATRGRAP